jgi:hypothetical protein
MPRLFHQSVHQFSEPYQICDPEDRAALAKRDLRIGRHDIRPPRQHRAYGLVVDAEQKPRPVPVVPLAHADKLPPAEWVEWVRHAHKTRCREGSACILS